jgi:biotin carboxylase
MVKILLLGAGEYQVRIVEELKSMGLYVIAVDKNTNSVGKEYAHAFCPIDIVNKKQVLQVAKEYKVDAIMPINDFGVRSAAFASKELSLVGLTEEAAELANNKFSMRSKWAEFDLPQPRFFKVTTYDDFEKAVESLGYPLIVKPADCGGGSRGVAKVKSRQEVEWAYSNAKKYTLFCNDMILEEFIPGIEVTVEGLIANGKSQVLAISDKEHFPSTRYCVASSLNYYANFPDDIIQKIIELANKAVKALGIDNSPFHIEMMINNGEPYLVEIGARGGGGHIFSTIVKWVSGVNYVQQYANILLGRNVDFMPKFKRGAVFRFLSASPGKIESIKHIDKVKSIDGVVDIQLFKKVGDIVSETSMDNERLGFVVVCKENRQLALDVIEEVEKIVEINTVPSKSGGD